MSEHAVPPDNDCVVATIAATQEQARRRLFVGRLREIATFRAMLQPGRLPRVFFVHGPAGIGKSALLQAYAWLARDAGVGYYPIDGRRLRTAPRLLAQAIRSVPSGCGNSSVRVLAIDHYDRIVALNARLREEWIPSLPKNILLVLASRIRPASAWFADPGLAELLVEQSLAGLEFDHAAEYLQRRGIAPEVSKGILTFARGYPLALALASDLAGRSESQTFDPACPDLIGALIQGLLADNRHPLQRQALQACASVRILDSGLLSAMLGQPADELYDWLARQALVQAQAGGLVIDNLAREVIIRDLRARDLAQHQRFIQRATDHLFADMEQASQAGAQNAISDAIYALRYELPIQRLYPCDDRNYLPDAARPEEIPALGDQIERLEGRQARGWFEYWMAKQPQRLIVLRDGTGMPVALLLPLLFGGEEVAAGSNDPATACFLGHLRQHCPLREREQGVLLRFLFAHNTHQQSTPVWAQVVATAQSMLFTPGAALVAFVADVSCDWIGLGDCAAWRLLVNTEYELGDRRFCLIGHDTRCEPPHAWARNLVSRVFYRGVHERTPTPEVAILDKQHFSGAVLDTLRHFQQKSRLQSSPLLTTNMLRKHAGRGYPCVDDLQHLIEQTCVEIANTNPGSPIPRVLETAYLHRETKKLVAARKLHMSERTFRRRLRQAEHALVESLWRYETDQALRQAWPRVLPAANQPRTPASPGEAIPAPYCASGAARFPG